MSKKKIGYSVSAVLLAVSLALLGIFIKMKIQEKKEKGNSSEDIIAEYNEVRNKYPDTSAWLDIPGTDISYPVMFSGENDEFYINHDFRGKHSKYGSLFIDSMNKKDFSDNVSVIYGHYSSSGLMFGNLRKIYSNHNSFAENNEFVLYLPEKVIKYKVFAALPVDDSHILYYNDLNTENGFNNYFDEILNSRSLEAIIDAENKPVFGRKVLILSTCLSAESDSRYIVIASEI